MSARLTRRALLGGLAASGGLAGAGILSGAEAGDDLSLPPDRFPPVFGTRMVLVGALPEAFARARVLGTALDADTMAAVETWRRGIKGLRAGTRATVARRAEPLPLLAAVNDYANRMPYIEDRDNYGLADYWADARAFFVAGGDCEDFAIAKFKILRAFGVDVARMRIVLLVNRARVAQHAVLAVAYGGQALVLDSLVAAVTPEARITTYAPTLSVSQEQLFRHVSAV